MVDLFTVGLVTAAAWVVFHVARSLKRDRRLIRVHEFAFQVGDRVSEWRAFAGNWPGVVVGVDPGSERPVLVQFETDLHHNKPGPVRWVPIEGNDPWGKHSSSLTLQRFYCEACHDYHSPRFADCLVNRPPPDRDAHEELLH